MKLNSNPAPFELDNTKGICVLLIAGDVDLYLLRYVEVSSLFTGTHLLFLAITSVQLIPFCPAHLSPDSKYIVFTSISFISMCFKVPICPLINRSLMLMLVVNMTLVLTFNSSNDARLPVSDCFQFCASLVSQIPEFLGTSSFADIVINCAGMCFN